MSQIEVHIDSTSLGRSACILHWHRHVVDGYCTKTLGASMLYGIAVHKFSDEMYKCGKPRQAMDAALALFNGLPVEPDEKKPWLRDEKHLQAVCLNYWTQWVQTDSVFEVLEKPEGGPATEQTFSFPIYEDEYVKVLLEGTIDAVGKFHNGVYAIKDLKTTAQWDTKAYWTQYQMSRQLRIYTIAFKHMAQTQPDSVFGKLGSTRLGAFIDGVFLTPKPNETTFERSDVFSYTDKQLDEFYLTLLDQCKRLSQAIKTGYIPKEGLVNGTCESKWSDGEKGKCDFWAVCKSNDQVAELLLGRDFVKKPFRPLQYNQ